MDAPSTPGDALTFLPSLPLRVFSQHPPEYCPAIPLSAHPGGSRSGPSLVIPSTKLHNLTLKIARRTAPLSGLIPIR